MKKLVLLSVLIPTTAMAISEPVEGFYGGLLAGISHGPGSNGVTFVEQSILDRTVFNVYTGKVTYSSAGAGGGAVLGYKLNHFRLEGEILYNRFSTGPLLVNDCSLQNIDIDTPTGICNADFQAKKLGYSGSSAATYGLVNLYVDFFTPHSETNLVPYLGLGIGKVQIRDFSSFVNTTVNPQFTYQLGDMVSHGSNITVTTNAVQGILGVSYFMDDFTWAGMDLRYTTTNALSQVSDSTSARKKYALTALMFNINFAFDVGAFSC